MTGNDCGCGERREYMTLGEYMALYPSAYAEATEQMTERQKRLFELRFCDRLLFLPKDETSEQGETLTITANISADTVTPDEDNPVETTPGGSFFWRYDVSDDAEAPTIAVEGAQYVKTAEGSLYVYDVISNVSISVRAALKTYQVTIAVENGTASPARTTIQARGTTTITIAPDANYELHEVEVTNATATKSGNDIVLSNPAGMVTLSVSCTRIMYNLLITALNCTYSPKYTQVAAGGTYAITFVADAGYDLPTIVTASGAQYSWKQATGVLTVYNPTDTTIVLVRATQKSYSITANITNGTATGANTIKTGETVALTIAANDGYELPDTITVTGASGTWNKSTGTLSISNPTGNVTVTGKCVAAVFTLVAGTYRFIASPTIPLNTNFSEYFDFVTSDSDHSSLEESKMYIVNDGDTLRNVIRYYTASGGVVKAYTDGRWKESSLRTIKTSSNQSVSAQWYNWAITSGNLVKQ